MHSGWFIRAHSKAGFHIIAGEPPEANSMIFEHYLHAPKGYKGPSSRQYLLSARQSYCKLSPALRWWILVFINRMGRTARKDIFLAPIHYTFEFIRLNKVIIPVLRVPL